MGDGVTVDSLLALLMNANQLKRVPRTGWVMRGVSDAESVADHTFGVTFIALILAQLVERPVDVIKLLTIALLHDLPEAVLSDIPSPALQYLSPSAKSNAESEVLCEMLAGTGQARRWQQWWAEYEEQCGLEAQLVRDADRLDMLVQASAYEQTTGNRCLSEFWKEVGTSPLQSEAARLLLGALRNMRKRSGQCEVD